MGKIKTFKPNKLSEQEKSDINDYVTTKNTDIVNYVDILDHFDFEINEIAVILLKYFLEEIKLLDVATITKEIALELVTHERNLRYSDRYQEIYRNNIVDDKRGDVPVEDLIQYEVLEHFGYDHNILNLSALRQMFGKFRNDPDVRNIAFWIGLNIMHDGVHVGTAFKDSIIYDVDKNPVKLSNLITRQTVIMAGSLS